MNQIMNCLEYYNIEREGNYYWIKNEDYVGTDLNIIFPVGYLANDKYLLDIYGELLVDHLCINTQKAYYTYTLGPTYFNIKIRVLETNLTPMIMMAFWNALNIFNSNLDHYLNNPILDLIIKKKLDNILSNEDKAIENMVNVDNHVRSILNNKEIIKKILDNTSKYILEKNAFVIYTGKYKIIHFDRDIKELVLPKYKVNLKEIEKEGKLIKFNNEEEALIVKEVLSLTNMVEIEKKYYNDDIYLFFKGERNDILNFSNLFYTNIDKIIDQVSYNQIQAFVSFKLNSFVNRLKSDPEMLVDNLINNNYVLSEDLDCLILYKYDINYIKKLIVEKFLNKIKEG